ncbi:MAG: hypothetical protein WC592_04920 [Candidatus Omnitrophota bacterium]
MKRKHAVDRDMPIGELKRMGDLLYSDKRLSMDDYVKFVNFCAKHFPRKRMSKDEWLTLHRGIPFSLK